MPFRFGRRNSDDEVKVVNSPLLRSFHGIRDAGKGSLDETDPTSAADAYRKSALIRRCARVRATTLADIPLRVLGTDDEELPENHPIARLFSPGNSRLFYNIELDMCIHGKAFVELSPYRPKLTRLNPATMYVETDPREGVTSFRQEIDGEIIATWPTRHMAYIHDYDPLDDLDSASPVDAAIVSAGLELNANDFARAYFANDATPAGMLSSDQELDQGQIKRIGGMWRRMFGGVGNRFKFGIGGSGLKFLPITPPLKDLSMSDLKAEVRRDICTAMEVPLTIALATDAANYATSREQRLSFYTETVLPELDLILDIFNSDILPFYQEGVRVEIDRAAIEVLQEDAIELTTRAVEGFGNGIYTLNEARKLEGLEQFPEVVDVIIINGSAIPVASLKKGMSAEELMAALAPPMLGGGPEDDGEGGQEGGQKPGQEGEKAPPGQAGQKPGQNNRQNERPGAAEAGKMAHPKAYVTDNFGDEVIEWRPVPPDAAQQALADLRRWRSKVKAKGVSAPFESEHIPPYVSALLRLDLQRLHAPDAFKLAKDDLEGRGSDQSERVIKLIPGEPKDHPLPSHEITGDDLYRAIVSWEKRRKGQPEAGLLNAETKTLKPGGMPAVKDDVEPPYVWNPKAMRYQEAGGRRRFVSRQKFIDLLEEEIKQHADEMADLTTKVFNRTMTVAAWEEAMRLSIKMAHTKLALLGRGGRQVMTLSERGALGGRLKSQYWFLSRYADVLREGLFAEKALLGLVRRSELYAKAARASFYDMQLRAAKAAGMDEKRRVLQFGAEHCEDCPAEASLGWVDIKSDEVTLPGSGDTQCLTNCRCTLEFRYNVSKSFVKMVRAWEAVKGYPEFRVDQLRDDDGKWTDEGRGGRQTLQEKIEDQGAGFGSYQAAADEVGSDEEQQEFARLADEWLRSGEAFYELQGELSESSRNAEERQASQEIMGLQPVDPETGEPLDKHLEEHSVHDYVKDPETGEIVTRLSLVTAYLDEQNLVPRNEFGDEIVTVGGQAGEDDTEFPLSGIAANEAREAGSQLQPLPAYRTPGGEEVPGRPIPAPEAPTSEGQPERTPSHLQLEASLVYMLKPVNPGTGEVIEGVYHGDHEQSDYVKDPRTGEIVLRSELTAEAQGPKLLAAQGSVPGWDASQLQGNRAVRKVPIEPLEGPATPFAPLEPAPYVEVRDQVDPRYKGMLTPYTAEDLAAKQAEGYVMFGTDSNGNGTNDAVYLMSPEMDIQGIVSTGEVKGAGVEIMIDAIARGGETLDAYDKFLPGYYEKFGFVEYERYEFDPQYAPPDWDFELHDSPDVVLMRYPEGLSRDPEEVRRRFKAAQQLERLQTGDN